VQNYDNEIPIQRLITDLHKKYTHIHTHTHTHTRTHTHTLSLFLSLSHTHTDCHVVGQSRAERRNPPRCVPTKFVSRHAYVIYLGMYSDSTHISRPASMVSTTASTSVRLQKNLSMRACLYAHARTRRENVRAMPSRLEAHCKKGKYDFVFTTRISFRVVFYVSSHVVYGGCRAVCSHILSFLLMALNWARRRALFFSNSLCRRA